MSLTPDSLPSMLTLNKLSAGYGTVDVLHGVSLTVPKGRVVALLGANGAGKTTTLRAISGQLPKLSGEVILDGQVLTGLSANRMARAGVAHCPEGRRVFPTLSVDDNLSLGAFTVKDSAAIAATREEVYGLFPRLRERSRQQAGTLSGGEQQMLAIGRALMAQPKVVLLDEPSMGLAPKIVGQVFDILAGLKEKGITMLLVEQFAMKALQVADYGYVLNRGEVVLHNSAEALLRDRALHAAYLS